jgi:hypothetical protein
MHCDRQDRDAQLNRRPTLEGQPWIGKPQVSGRGVLVTCWPWRFSGRGGFQGVVVFRAWWFSGRGGFQGVAWDAKEAGPVRLDGDDLP